MGLAAWTAQLDQHARTQVEVLAGASGPSDRRLAALLEVGQARGALADAGALDVLLEALDLAAGLGREAEEALATVELGSCLVQHGQASLGRVHLSRVLERRSSPELLRARAAAELAIAFLGEGDRVMARAALPAAGSGPYAVLARGALAQAAGDADEAARCYELAIQGAGALRGIAGVVLQCRAGQALVELEAQRQRDPRDAYADLEAEELRRVLVALAEVGCAGRTLARAAEALASLCEAQALELEGAGTSARWPEDEPPGEHTPRLLVGGMSLRAWPAPSEVGVALASAFLSVAGPWLGAGSQPEDERGRVLALLDELLASDLEGASLFDLATRLAIRATGAQRGTLVRTSGDGPQVTPPYVSRSLVRRVALTGRPLLLEDAAVAPPSGAGESVSAQELRSVLAVPLLGRRGQTLGVLYLDDPGSAGRFGASELSVLTGFANRLGPQLESSLREVLRRASAAQPAPTLAATTSASPSMRAALELLARASEADVSLLLCGEAGVGKEHAARLVHESSSRAEGPFVTLPCGTLSDELLESELFGHKAGAFTGAVRDRAGVLESADGGVVFLDGLEDASPRLQAELLRAVESGEIRPLGGEAREIDVRFMAGFRGNPQEAVAAGRLRQDLLYRLNLLTVQIPPLRERREDLPQLVSSILAGLGAAERSLSGPALERLRSHPWPGNLRELQACLERALLSAEGTILPSHLLLDAPRRPGPAVRLNRRQLELLDRLEPGQRVKAGDYAERSQISPATAWRDLTDLVAKGLLRAEGRGRGAAYRLA